MRSSIRLLAPLSVLLFAGPVLFARDPRSAGHAPVSRPMILRLETASADIDVRPRRAEGGGVDRMTTDDIGTINWSPTRMWSPRCSTRQGAPDPAAGCGCWCRPGPHRRRTQSGDIKVRDLGAWARVHSLYRRHPGHRCAGGGGEHGGGRPQPRRQRRPAGRRPSPASCSVARSAGCTGSGAVIEMITTSGDLSWSGVCGAGCRPERHQPCRATLQLAFDPRAAPSALQLAVALG
jgi:hypothetical protein